MSFSDVGIKEDCVYRLSFESGADIELYEYCDPISHEKHLRISREDVELKLFDEIVDHATRYVNSRKQRIQLGDPSKTRMNPRYKRTVVRSHLVVIAADMANASKVLQPTNHLQLCCQLITSDGQTVPVPNVERCNVPLGVITQSILIAPPLPSLPRQI